MKVSPAAQVHLVDIQALDDRLRQAEHARRNPPQADRVKELLAQRQAQSQELTTRRGAREDLQTELSRLEADVKVVEARRARDESLLQVSTNSKEAQGLEHELESLRKRQSDLEDLELDLMERIEIADAGIAEQEALMAQTNEEGARLSAEAKAVVADAAALSEQLTRDRDALRTLVDTNVLAFYDRLSERGTGAALLQGRTCGACHMVLTGSDYERLRTIPEDEIAFCPQCSAILVRAVESGA